MRRVVLICVLTSLAGLIAIPSAEARACSAPAGYDFYSVRSYHLSCTRARKLLRRVARTPCVIGHTCHAYDFTYRLRGPGARTVARREDQIVSWRSTYSD
jgi:hypothetical protein